MSAQDMLSLGHREGVIQNILIQQELARRTIWAQCAQKVASFEAGPLLWLTKHTATEDLHWLQKGTDPVAPFPTKQYLAVAMGYLLTNDTIFIPKSREMMTSWLVCGYISWMCQWLPHIFWILQTEKEDKATQLITYCRILFDRQADWMKERNPLVVSNSVELKRANGSHILAVPQGENQVRLFHPYGYMQDESAFLPEAEQSFNAVRPVCKQIIAVSSDEIGWFHNECKR
jgi:hypothetical protein